MESFMKRVDSESQGYFHHKLPQGNSVTVFRELNSFFLCVVPEQGLVQTGPPFSPVLLPPERVLAT